MEQFPLTCCPPPQTWAAPLAQGPAPQQGPVPQEAWGTLLPAPVWLSREPLLLCLVLHLQTWPPQAPGRVPTPSCHVPSSYRANSSRSKVLNILQALVLTERSLPRPPPPTCVAPCHCCLGRTPGDGHRRERRWACRGESQHQRPCSHRAMRPRTQRNCPRLWLRRPGSRRCLTAAGASGVTATFLPTFPQGHFPSGPMGHGGGNLLQRQAPAAWLAPSTENRCGLEPPQCL